MTPDIAALDHPAAVHFNGGCEVLEVVWGRVVDLPEPLMPGVREADVAGNGVFANIADATSVTYMLTPDDQGDTVRLIEVLSDNAGSAFVTSAGVSVAPAVPSGLAFVEPFDIYADMAGIQ
jgi:hypothetical protein